MVRAKDSGPANYRRALSALRTDHAPELHSLVINVHYFCTRCIIIKDFTKSTVWF